MPESARFRQARDLRAVTRLGMLFPFRNGLVLLDLGEFPEDRLIFEVIELLPTEIIIASFHVTDAQLTFNGRSGEQNLFQKRNIFIEELLLQILRARRDDYTFAGTNRWQQIGERLARSGAGFDEQVSFVVNRLLDRFGHLELSPPELVCRMAAGKCSSGSEE